MTNETSTRRVTFGAEPLVLGRAFAPPEHDDLPARGLRGVSLETARAQATPYVAKLLALAPIVGDRRFVLVELRVADLAAGDAPGQATWHVDTVGEPWHASAPERHHLFVGGTACLPEFLAGPLELDVPTNGGAYARMDALDRQVRALRPSTRHAPPLRFVSYGRLNLHRARPALRAERRLLLRVTETDVLRPRG